ncbi:g402 [Coccomyxa elongata]
MMMRASGKNQRQPPSLLLMYTYMKTMNNTEENQRQLLWIMKAAPSPITQQLSGLAANSKKGPGGLEHNTPLDSQTPAAVNQESAEPPKVQTASSEAEEQRIADELAALEAEAEALALQVQQHETVSHDAGMDLSRYSVSLADESRSADRAMAEAQQVSEQASSGATAMQSALDSFEPRARPFSPPPGSAPLQRFSPIGEFVEPPELQGLLYYDGLDMLARPVVVINADAVAEEKGARKAAIQYLLQQLEPVVSQGPYVLVMVNTGRSHKSNRLQASWLVSAYRGLSRPFRKNVKYIILVRPSKALKAFLTMLRPFLSRKAHRKVVKVESLSGIAEATGNEVTLQHLGARFAAAAGRSVSDDLSLTSPTLRGASSPMFPSSPH